MSLLAANQLDPTRTVMLRRRYMSEMRTRFLRVKKLIRTTVADNDALGIGDPRMLTLQVGPIDRFPFPTDAAKVQAFMDWLGEAVDQEVLGVVQREGRRVVAHAEWQNAYVRSAYETGVLSANAKLAAVGVEVPAQAMFGVFNAPRHADAMGMLFTRNFEELKGISDAMSQAISRELAQGMAEGIGPREMGRRLAQQVDGIGVGRGQLLARTEVIRAHAESTLNRFEDFGLEEVEGKAEFLTAGDDRVCSICQGLEGQVMSISQARGLIPVHPSCRCTWLPVVPEPRRVRAPSPLGFSRAREFARVPA